MPMPSALAFFALIALADPTKDAPGPTAAPQQPTDAEATIEEPAADTDESLEEPPDTDVDELDPLDPEQLMFDIGRRIRLADYDGARILLDVLADIADADLAEVTYLRGVSWELDRDYPRALALYEQGISQFPDSPRAEDFLFRRAEITGAMGQTREALVLLKPFLKSAHARPEADQVKIRLVHATLLADRGRTRRALKRIEQVLGYADASHAPFYQAKARAVQCRHLANVSQDLLLSGSEKRIVTRLTERGALLLQMESIVTEIALAKEPEWVLDGLMSLGQGYAQVGRDLLAVEPSKRLVPELRQQLEVVLAERAEIVLIKALNHYQEGIELAMRLGWRSRRVGELQQARDALQQEIETLLPRQGARD